MSADLEEKRPPHVFSLFGGKKEGAHFEEAEEEVYVVVVVAL